MNIFNSKFDPIDYFQSLPDLLIHEITKPVSPFDYDKKINKIPLKYKNPEVRIIKLFYSEIL